MAVGEQQICASEVTEMHAVLSAVETVRLIPFICSSEENGISENGVRRAVFSCGSARRPPSLCSHLFSRSDADY